MTFSLVYLLDEQVPLNGNWSLDFIVLQFLRLMVGIFYNTTIVRGTKLSFFFHSIDFGISPYHLVTIFCDVVFIFGTVNKFHHTI